jgi:hypothetical protein
MSFIDREVNFNRGSSKYKRTEFMALSNGAHTVRILDEQAKTVPTHFFNNTKTTVLCLEENCPICDNNKKLISQFPNNFREQPSYNKVTYRFVVNVYDKTPAKVCSKCGKEWKNLQQTVCSCGEVLPAQAQPLNKVKVLSKGITLRDDLGSVEKAILDPSGTPIGLQNYDVTLMVTGAGTKDAKVTPVPRTDSTQPVDLGEQEKYDLDKVTIVLEPSEMLDAQRGISLKDIFNSRKKEEVTFEPAVSQDELDKVNDAVSKLFNE